MIEMQLWCFCSTAIFAHAQMEIMFPWILQLSFDQHQFVEIKSHKIHCATKGQKNPHCK